MEFNEYRNSAFYAPEYLRDPEPEKPLDMVEHPSHYTAVVPGIECIQVTQHFNFNRGNVIKYVWRAGVKGDTITDLKKARQYLDFEIARLEAK